MPELLDTARIAHAIRGGLASFREEVRNEEVGEVVHVEEGIARIRGLPNVMTEEMLLFEGGVVGMAFNLERDEVGAILLGDAGSVVQGALVRRLDRVLSVPVGHELLGRVVNALAEPIDGRGPIAATVYREVAGPAPHVAASPAEEVDRGRLDPYIHPDGLTVRALEAPAPGVTQRQPVSEPLHTGVTCIDALIPLGRGQRELVIGDRQTGKTSVAIDAILSQRDSGVLCIYVAIGQRLSSVVSVVETLKSHGAMDHTVVVSATAAEPITLQYIAPYTGCAIGEHFRDSGGHALVVYDDLSKHAVAYRSISLLLRRPPGREAFPGDIFNIHSRLLERSAKLLEKHVLVPRARPAAGVSQDDAVDGSVWEGEDGRTRAVAALEAHPRQGELEVALVSGTGGSLTALPIVETLEGDYAAYIPTNIISITDGQIYLEADLFRSGIRPALNVGLSVSRVGGHAQTKAMKQVAGKTRLDLAQYRDLAAFAQISAEIDPASQRQLTRGARLIEILKQPTGTPLPLWRQVVVLWLGVNGHLDSIPVERVPSAMATLFSLIESRYPHVQRFITEHKALDDDIQADLHRCARELAAVLGVEVSS
ncbi:F0F1 ATP synthase subunit alpha [Candidatus Fermentibacteria bacterium]|nr:F0F1 ATP synthase subunit alpha [Candidatus Fermentibacteria bacterium]